MAVMAASSSSHSPSHFVRSSTSTGSTTFLTVEREKVDMLGVEEEDERCKKSGKEWDGDGKEEVRSFIQEQSPLRRVRGSAPTARFAPIPSIEQHEAALLRFDRHLPCALRALAPLPLCIALMS